MSGRASDVYEFITQFKEKFGMAPTFREIGKACGIPTTSMVSNYLNELEQAQLIKRHKGVARGIVLLMERA